MKLTKSFIFVSILFAMCFVGVCLMYSGGEQVPEIEPLINFSSSEYKDLDLWKENITFEAISQKGELIKGIEWFGVNGVYSNERPLIFGDNEYTYWIENDSYIVIPQKLTPDIYHVKQKVIAQTYEIKNIQDFRIMSMDSLEEEIVFKERDDDYLIGEFYLKYYSEKVSKFPLGAILIVEYDRNISDVMCSSLREHHYPYFYSIKSFDSKVTVFKMGIDKGDWGYWTEGCKLFKMKDRKIENTNVSFSIYPLNYYLTEDMELRVGVEDEYYNLKTKKIFEKEVEINEI